MNKLSIHNISFVINEGAIEFTFTKGNDKNSWGKASLQFPDLGNSQYIIDDLDLAEWEDEQEQIFDQLKNYFYDSCKINGFPRIPQQA